MQKKGVGGVGDDQTDGASSLQAQTLDDTRRAVAQGLDRPEGPLARCLGHRTGAVVHQITDGGDGDARALRDLGFGDAPLCRVKGGHIIYSWCLLVLRFSA